MSRDNDSWARRRTVSNAEYDLRWEYSRGDMTLDDFNKRLKELRDGDTTKNLRGRTR